MTFLILTTDYPSFLTWLYAQHPRLKAEPYETQIQRRREVLFSGAYLWSSHLRRLGHESYDIYPNNEFIQKAWARENRLRLRQNGRWKVRLRRGLVPWVWRDRDSWLYDILAAQIQHYRPNIILNQAMNTLSSRFLKKMKAYVRFLVGEHAASPLPPGEDYGCYDLVVSSVPSTVDLFRKQGVPAELSRLGFDPAWLACADGGPRAFDVTFIGSFFDVHAGRVALLESLCRRFPLLKIWSPGIDHLAPASAIRAAYQGAAWGREMYRVLSCSKVTLNHHGNLFAYANNLRLYEATGMGALLLTDWKANLYEMFEPGREIVAYRSSEECADLLRYYLQHDDQRDAIARAGQQRALKDHTYSQRIEELVDILGKYL